MIASALDLKVEKKNKKKITKISTMYARKRETPYD